LTKSDDLISGTLDLLILRVIALEPKHGWAIAQRIQQVSKEILQVRQGSLYPALHRLEEREWVESEWQLSATRRRTKVYRLTTAGRRQLRAETNAWEQFVAAVGKVIATQERPA